MSVSTLVRRIARRSAKPLVMAGLAGTLALGMVAVPVAKAEADLLTAKTIAEINGAMRMPLTHVVVNAIKLHPVGFALGTVAALGLYAYATKDQWWPYVTGAFGEPPVDQPAAGGTKSLAGFLLTGNTLQAPNRMAIAYTYQGSTSSKTYTITTLFDCRQLTNTPPRVVGEVFKNSTTFSGGVSGQGATGPAVAGTTGAGRVCPDGSEIIGGTMGPDTVNPNGPMNMLTYGGVGGFDPRGADTNYVVSAECIDAAGNISVIEYTSKGTDGMLRMPPCGVMVPGSHGTGKMWIDGYAPGSTVPQRLYDMDPMTDPDHPLCSPSRPGSGCTLGVSIDGKPCVIGDIQCENWTEIRRDDATGARVSCQYGPYTVGVEQCNILERAYQIGGAPATDANIDGNPSTSHYAQPNGDPWKPQPQPSYNTGTGTTTAPGGFPTSGTSGNPEDPCLKDAWSWTPADWVKNPVVCALKDAFVPKQDVQARSNELKQKAMDTVPIAWLSGPITGPAGGGCPNWTINVAGMSENVVCNSSFTQALLGVRTPLFGLVAAAMVWPLIRGIWYASIPVLRVSPGSSK